MKTPDGASVISPIAISENHKFVAATFPLKIIKER